MTAGVFQRIWLPGFLFMGVLIGGGYATGRELVEFFLTAGTVGGLFGMVLATVLFSVIATLSFELSRITQSDNYRSFFQTLLGRWWFLFEIAYFILGLLVLAVIASAAGEIVAKHIGFSKVTGTVGLMIAIGILVFFGTSLVEKVLSGWSILLYVTYVVFVGWYLWEFNEDFFTNLPQVTLGSDWLMGGIKYVGYSIAVIPIILFSTRHMQSRSDAILAGMLAGPIAMAPAMMFFLTMIATYPEVLHAAVPLDYMISRLNENGLQLAIYIVMFGTFVQTGTGFIHALNERINELYREKHQLMPRWLRPVIAFVALISSIVLANEFGLITLIAKGYGSLTWAFIVIFLLPLLTVGFKKIYLHKPCHRP